MGDRDRPDYLDRDKKSFSELDRQRRERRDRGDAPPASPGAQRRAAAAAKQYVKQLDGLFAPGKGGAAGEKLAQAVQSARGTPGLDAACRAYLEALGPPADARLVACFLDSTDAAIAGAGLVGARALVEAGSAPAGLRTQLRLLAEHPDDAVAGEAEALLERL
jgi:hypothetical protein